jgi:hypothetical protein
MSSHPFCSSSRIAAVMDERPRDVSACSVVKVGIAESPRSFMWRLRVSARCFAIADRSLSTIAERHVNSGES